MNLYEIRKHLHQIPELGFSEFKTTKYVIERLKQYSELKITTFDFTGLLVEYSHGNGDYKLFRADMDALPIQEDDGCLFHSLHPGLMHACGHDVHMTILLGLIERVIKSELKENLLFVFQPAEEGYGGALRFLQTGLLDKYQISEAYALHVNGHLPVGTIETKPGVFFANTQEVTVKFIGKSAHVAFPQNGRNALAAGADFYLNLQIKIKEEFSEHNKAICEFGKMQAGTVMNAIAAECSMDGTMRAFEIEDWNVLKSILEDTATASAAKYDLKHELVYNNFYKRVVNHPDLYEKVKSRTIELGLNFKEATAVFTGEDFGYFADRYKGLLFWLGAHSGQMMDLHSTNFLPDEKAIDVGLKVLYDLI
jgi:N-acetyldiaminopimelate deacetylase